MLNKLPNELLYKVANYLPKKYAGRMFTAVKKVYKPSRKTFHGKQRIVYNMLKKPVSKARYKTMRNNVHKAQRKRLWAPYAVTHHRGYNRRGQSFARQVNGNRARGRGLTKSWDLLNHRNGNSRWRQY